MARHSPADIASAQISAAQIPVAQISVAQISVAQVRPWLSSSFSASHRCSALPDHPSLRPTTSAAANWAALAPFVAAEERLGRWAGQRPLTAFVYEFVRFGVKQAWACLFGGAMVALLIGTYLWYPRVASLARYDFCF